MVIISTPPNLPSIEFVIQEERCSAKAYRRYGIRRLAKCFGLRIMGITRTIAHNNAVGGARDSFHLHRNAFNRFGRPRVADVFVTAGVYVLARYALRHPGEFVEFIFSPLKWSIDNGKIIKGYVGGHLDHMHIVLRK